MTSEPWYQVIDELRALLRFSRHMSLRLSPTYEGLQTASFGILTLLVRQGGLRLTAVAEQHCIDISVASRQVAELVDRGLVERAPDPQDARAHQLVATDEGRALALRVRERQRELAAQALRSWDHDELRVLADNLSRLNGDLRAGFGGQPDQSDLLSGDVLPRA